MECVIWSAPVDAQCLVMISWSRNDLMMVSSRNSSGMVCTSTLELVLQFLNIILAFDRSASTPFTEPQCAHVCLCPSGSH